MYTGLVYFHTVHRRRLADTVFGARKAIIMGGLLMALGHFAMAFESLAVHRARVVDRRQRFFQAEHLDAGRWALRAGRHAARHRFHDLSTGHQPGALIAPPVCGLLGSVSVGTTDFAAAGSA